MTDSLTVSVMIVLSKFALDKGENLVKDVGPDATEKAAELFYKTLARLGREAGGEFVANEFEKKPAVYEKPFAEILAAVVQTDPNWANQLQKLLVEYQTEAQIYAKTADISIATLKGSGAISQVSGDVLGERAVMAGNVHGSIVTGNNNIVSTGGSSTSIVELPPTLAPLRNKLTQHFNRDGLKVICFDLGVAPDDLPGETRTEIAQALVAYCYERGRLADLRSRCREERPQVDWT
jgi:hypothetical protein